MAGEHAGWQDPVAGQAGPSLQVRAAPTCTFRATKPAPSRPGRPFDHVGLLVGVRAEPVVDVHRHDRRARGAGQGQQGDGVGPARDRGGHLGPRRREGAAGQQIADTVDRGGRGPQQPEPAARSGTALPVGGQRPLPVGGQQPLPGQADQLRAAPHPELGRPGEDWRRRSCG